MRVLHFYPWGQFFPITCGADYVAANQMEYCQERGWEVHCLFPQGFGHGVRDPKALSQRFPCVKSIRSVKFPACACTFRELLLATDAAATTPDFRALAAESFDVFFTNYVFSAPFACRLPRSCFKVVETHDLVARMLAADGGQGGRPAAPAPVRDREGRFVLETVERDLYDCFDRAVMISEEEARVMRALGCAHVRYVRQMFAAPAGGGPLAEAHDLCFVGADHPANVRSLNWFYRNVYVPYLRRERVRFAVVGSASRHLPVEDSCVTRVARYDGPIGDLYAASKLVVVPNLEGTGISVKFHEALAAGAAVVTTPAGARGCDPDGGAFVCLDMRADPRRTGETILDLLRDEPRRRALRERAAALSRVSHSREQYFRAMDEVFRPVLDLQSRT
jgi:hypothetical protein